jgi:hypothetical protein
MFRTPVSLVPSKHPISLENKILSIGSCFADFIGNRLAKNKFQVLSNPCGIVYHPLAQFKLLELSVKETQPPESTFVSNQGIWYNYLFHSSISHSSRLELGKIIKRKLQVLKMQLDNLDFLLLTFGTSIQYRHLQTDLVVANCHKVPSSEFDKSLTPIETIVEAFNQIQSDLKLTSTQVLLSVSPIRHLKEGLLTNSLSKSVLRVTCEQITESNNMVEYFPGYEIMMDDLRDYRFFEQDMIHPNNTAKDYIWDLFGKNYLDDSARKFVKQWRNISARIEHRPFHPHAPAHQDFIQKTLELFKQLPENIDTSDEIALFKQNMK